MLSPLKQERVTIIAIVGRVITIERAMKQRTCTKIKQRSDRE